MHLTLCDLYKCLQLKKMKTILESVKANVLFTYKNT